MNPNGIAKAFFGARESGAEDWESVFEDTGTYQTLTKFRHLRYHLYRRYAPPLDDG
jgi:hypothetical protein